MEKEKNEDIISKENFQEIINNLDVGYFKGVFNGKLLIHNTAINKILGIDPLVDLTKSHLSQFFSNPDVQKSYHEELSKNGANTELVILIKTLFEQIDDKKVIELLRGLLSLTCQIILLKRMSINS